MRAHSCESLLSAAEPQLHLQKHSTHMNAHVHTCMVTSTCLYAHPCYVCTYEGDEHVPIHYEQTHGHVCAHARCICLWRRLFMRVTHTHAYTPISVCSWACTHSCTHVWAHAAAMQAYLCMHVNVHAPGQVQPGWRMCGKRVLCSRRCLPFPGVGWGRLGGHRTFLPEAAGLSPPVKAPGASPLSHPGQGSGPGGPASWHPVPWHQSQRRRRSRNPLLAEGKGGSRELEWL